MANYELKPGVRIDLLQPQMALAAGIVANTYKQFGYGCVITSGNEGKHSRDSLHYAGKALDFRTNHVRERERPRLRDAVARALGEEFDVVLEATHLHVEYDPPRPTS